MHFELSLLKIPVTDIGVSAAFYRDKLGFEQQFVVEEYGWAQFRAGIVPLALYVPGMGGGDRTPGGSVDFQLEGPDLIGYAMLLENRGVDIGEGVMESGDDGYFLEVSDPDGNVLKFVQFRGRE